MIDSLPSFPKNIGLIESKEFINQINLILKHGNKLFRLKHSDVNLKEILDLIFPESAFKQWEVIKLKIQNEFLNFGQEAIDSNLTKNFDAFLYNLLKPLHYAILSNIADVYLAEEFKKISTPPKYILDEYQNVHLYFSTQIMTIVTNSLHSKILYPLNLYIDFLKIFRDLYTNRTYGETEQLSKFEILYTQNLKRGIDTSFSAFEALDKKLSDLNLSKDEFSKSFIYGVSILSKFHRDYVHNVIEQIEQEDVQKVFTLFEYILPNGNVFRIAKLNLATNTSGEISIYNPLVHTGKLESIRTDVDKSHFGCPFRHSIIRGYSLIEIMVDKFLEYRLR